MTEIAPEPVATSKRLRTGMASYERVKMAIPSSPSLDVLSPALLAVSEFRDDVSFFFFFGLKSPIGI